MNDRDNDPAEASEELREFEDSLRILQPTLSSTSPAQEAALMYRCGWEAAESRNADKKSVPSRRPGFDRGLAVGVAASIAVWLTVSWCASKPSPTDNHVVQQSTTDRALTANHAPIVRRATEAETESPRLPQQPGSNAEATFAQSSNSIADALCPAARRQWSFSVASTSTVANRQRTSVSTSNAPSAVFPSRPELNDLLQDDSVWRSQPVVHN